MAGRLKKRNFRLNCRFRDVFKGKSSIKNLHITTLTVEIQAIAVAGFVNEPEGSWGRGPASFFETNAQLPAQAVSGFHDSFPSHIQAEFCGGFELTNAVALIELDRLHVGHILGKVQGFLRVGDIVRYDGLLKAGPFLLS